MGWFHAAYAAGELGDIDGATCSLSQKPKRAEVPPCPTTLSGVEVIYHMTPRCLWEQAIKEGVAYFPPTFHKDGKFTRASVFKEGLIDVANHFYKETSPKEVEWICLELNLKYLLNMGVVVLPQPPDDASGETEEKKEEEPVQCFQIYAGIATIPSLDLVQKIYPVKRGGCGTFLELGDPQTHGKAKGTKKSSSRHLERVEQVRAETEKIKGLGSVPAASKSKSTSNTTVTPKRSGSFSKGGIGKMFGVKSNKNIS